MGGGLLVRTRPCFPPATPGPHPHSEPGAFAAPKSDTRAREALMLCSAGSRGQGGFLPPALCPLLFAGTALPLPLSPAAGQAQALAVPCHLLQEEPCSPASKVGSSPPAPSGTRPSPYRAPSVWGPEARPSLRVSPRQAVPAPHRQGPGLGPDGGCGLGGGRACWRPGGSEGAGGRVKTRVGRGQEGAHVGSRRLWGSVG